MGGGELETAFPGLAGSIPWRGRTPREHRSRRVVSPARRDTDSGEVPGLEGERHGQRMLRATGGSAALPRTGRPSPKEAEDIRRTRRQRQEGCGRREALRLRPEGKALKGHNPMGVTGMKQGRAGREGANRQEGEKPWRRTVPGEASPGRVDLPVLKR